MKKVITIGANRIMLCRLKNRKRYPDSANDRYGEVYKAKTIGFVGLLLCSFQIQIHLLKEKLFL
jgi:hypothetical protein